MSHTLQEESNGNSSNAAFWAVLIFVGLIIGTINFVKVQDATDTHSATTEAGHEHHEAAAEEHPAQPATTEAHAQPAGHDETGNASTPASQDTESAH